jgi:hypothetical protein
MTAGGFCRALGRRRGRNPACRPAANRELSTGPNIPLDSFAALAANHPENQVPRRCRRAFCWRAIWVRPAWSAGSCHRFIHASPIIGGARLWLIFWFRVRAPGLRFQPASRPNGFCSRAFRASRCRYAARLAARCTSGNPMTPGSAPPGHPAMEVSRRHPEARC